MRKLLTRVRNRRKKSISPILFFFYEPWLQGNGEENSPLLAVVGIDEQRKAYEESPLAPLNNKRHPGRE